MKPFTWLHLGLLGLALLNMISAVEVENSWGVYTIAVLAAALSLALSRPDGSSWMPRGAIYAMILLAAAYLLYEMFYPQEEPTVYILDLSHFMIFLACCKFFELSSHRDYALVATISFLLLVISGFASGSPIFGLVLVLDLTLGLVWLMHFQSVRAELLIAQRREKGMRPLGLALPVPRQTGVRRAAFMLPAMLCAIGMLLLAGLVFLAVPRGWGRGLFVRIQGVMPTAVTAYSPEITLEDAHLIEDDTPVMKVRFIDKDGPLNSERLVPYMRGTTFERYDRSRWFPLRRSQTLLTVASHGAPRSLARAMDLPPDAGVVTQEIWLGNLSSGYLFSMYPPLDISSKDIENIRLNEKDLSIHTDERPRSGVRYVVRTAMNLPPASRVLLDPPPENPTRPARMSVIHPDVRRFAQEFFERYGDPADPLQRRKLATNLCDYFTSGEFEYTLNRGARLQGTDAIRDFLFVRRRGHCEYFASAMAVMCQAAGIPARIVNGYMGGEYHETGGYFQFRQKDAHAWVEVFVSDEGWVLFDPSPRVLSRGVAGEQGLLTKARNFMDLLQFKWSTLVVAFDAENWYNLVEGLSSWLEKLQATERSGNPQITLMSILWGPDLLPLWQRFFYWLLLVLVACFLVLTLRALGILSLMLREYLSATGRRREKAPRRVDARFYDRLLLLLASKGHAKLHHQTPMEFAVDLARSSRDFAPLPRLTECFYRAQYGRRSIGREENVQIRAFLARLREDPGFGAR